MFTWWHKRQAKKKIFEFVKSYKRLCTGNNRFVVTPPVLQDAFRKYNIDVIEYVWGELIKEHIIQQDPMDNEWCIR